MIEYITTYWLLLSLEALAGFSYYLFNELEDECVRSTWTKYKQFLNTNLSWTNKWKLDANNNLMPYITKWYNFGIKPNHCERFAFSSTLLVFLTDGEHLTQFIKNISILIALFIVSWQFMLAFVVGKLAMSLIKETLLKWMN
jgi:hypothetical protein